MIIVWRLRKQKQCREVVEKQYSYQLLHRLSIVSYWKCIYLILSNISCLQCHESTSQLLCIHAWSCTLTTVILYIHAYIINAIDRTITWIKINGIHWFQTRYNWTIAQIARKKRIHNYNSIIVTNWKKRKILRIENTIFCINWSV